MLDVERARGGRRRETLGGRTWVVQSISAAAAVKTYRCPGCQQEILPGTAHVVAGEADALLGEQAALDSRRHWHSGCWRSSGGRPGGLR